MSHLRISEAAELLDVSSDTVRRWLDSGRLAAAEGVRGPRAVDGASLAAFMVSEAPDAPTQRQSARNRFPGIVIRVERDGVMALVEIQAGPHRVTSLMSRESADELQLAPGVLVAALIKSTNVVVELEDRK
ncbi:MAG: TOBE domain-containing protein [Actinomycetota bacterium]|nr:TOBE domain-containing protein [Actinomycetota bacterium]